MEFANVCLCGNEEPPSDKKTEESECTSKCAANKDQTCGALGRANIYDLRFEPVEG